MHRWIKWLLARAARDTSSGQFIPEIDGLRFIAIASVVLFHLNWFLTSKTGRPEAAIPLTKFLSYGGVGVQLFFVISGFVIALPFAKGRLLGGAVPKLKTYLLRRLTRLEPPYILNLVIRFALLTLVMKESPADLLPHLLASMAYLHNVIYGCMSSVNFVAWSLEIELQFYLLAPLVTLLFAVRSKLARRLLFASLIALFSLAAGRITGSQRCALSILSSGQYFLTGFLLVDVYLTDWKERPQRSLSWDVVSLLSWSGLILTLYERELQPLIVVPIFFAYQAAFRGSLSSRFFRWQPVYVIGGMCYTIYLYHYLVISALLRPLLQLPFWGEFPLWLELAAASLVLLPAVLLFSAVMFVLIEKPCMQKDWHWRLLDRCRSGLRRAAA